MLSKEERFKQEHTIFQSRADLGLQTLRTWLYDRQAEINLKWPGMAGEDLIRLQGEAGLIARLIKMVDKGPTIPQQTKEVTHV